MTASSDDDILLMQRLASGEDLALNTLMSRWRERVAAFLLRMVGDHATAMDLTQEAFVRLYTSRHSYRPTAAFSTYLFHIAANLARSHARWKRRHPTVSMEDEQVTLIHEPVDPQLQPDEATALHEKTALVNRAIAAQLGIARLWLHAQELRLQHPVTGAPLVLRAEPGPQWDGLQRFVQPNRTA